MTGQRFEEEDDLNFDDEFVIDFSESETASKPAASPDASRRVVEPGAAAGPAGSGVDGSGTDRSGPDGLSRAMQFGGGRRTSAPSASGESEEDMLFVAGEERRPAESAFDADLGHEFSEQGDDDWRGGDLALEGVIGLAGDDSATEDLFESTGDDEDPFAIEDVELERLDDFVVVADSGSADAGDGANEWVAFDVESEQHDAGEAWSATSVADDAPDWGDEGADVADGAPVFEGAFGSGRNDEFFGDAAEPTEEFDSMVSAAQAAGWTLRDDAPPGDDELVDDAIYGEAEQEYQEYEDEATDETAWEPADDQEPDYSEHEASFVDGNEVADRRLIAAGGRSRRSRFGSFFAIAAIVVASMLGAIAFWHPDWLGFGADPVATRRIAVARPSVEVALVAPTATFPVQVAVDPTTPPGGPDVPNTDPVTPTDPVIVPPPGGENPVAVTDPDPPPVVDPPVIVDPVAPSDPLPVAVTQPRDPTAPDGPIEPRPGQTRPQAPIEIGDHLVVRPADPVSATEDPRMRGVAPGTNAYALLTNQAFFIGRVKRVTDARVTLQVESGEVSIAFADLSRLVPVANADQVVSAEHGYVRLNNHARLFGSIMSTDDESVVVLRTQESRISIPRAQVQQTGLATRGGVEISESTDDEWVQQQARQRMESLMRPVRPEEQGSPVPEPRVDDGAPVPTAPTSPIDRR